MFNAAANSAEGPRTIAPPLILRLPSRPLYFLMRIEAGQAELSVGGDLHPSSVILSKVIWSDCCRAGDDEIRNPGFHDSQFHGNFVMIRDIPEQVALAEL